MQLILGTVVGLCFFIVPMWAYRKGMNDGLNVAQGKQIQPIKSPVQVVNDKVAENKAKKEVDVILEGAKNLMSYTGEDQGGENK